MEGTSSSFFPANYVTLKDLQERWIKRKQEEENEEKLRRIREEEEIKLRSENEARNHRLKTKKPTGYKKKPPSSPAAPASNSQRRERKKKNLADGFNANEGEVEKAADEKSETSAAIAGRRKDLQKRRIRSKKEEENEEKLCRFREEEEIKPHKEKEAKNHQSKSKNPTYSEKKSPSSPAAPSSHSHGRERKEKNLASGFNANQLMVSKATEAKSETSAAIAGRRIKRGSRRARIPPREPESVVKVGDKEEEEEKVLESAPGDQTAEICLKVADLSVGTGGNRRSGRISRGGGFREWRYGGTARTSASGSSMVWVRKT